LNEFDAALDLLERVFAEANLTLVNAATNDPDFDSLRIIPRFAEMLAAVQLRLGIAEPTTPAAS
jgi:hypothetical protein